MSNKLDGYQVDLYNSVAQKNDFTLVSGQFVLPVATNDPDEDAVVVVRAHKDYRLRTLSFSAEKENNPPVLPSPQNIGGFSFLGGTTSIPYPTLTPSAGFKWSVATELTFVETGAIDLVSDGYVLGSLPWVYAGQLDNQQYAGYPSQSAPDSIQEAGLGPKAGYVLAANLDPSLEGWSYAEPSFFPGTLQSSDLVNGPTLYPTLGSA